MLSSLVQFESPYADISYTRVGGKGAEQVRGPVIGESHWRLYVNEREWVTILCTPRDLHYLAVGFLCSEGVIHALEDIVMLRAYERVDRSYCYVPSFGINGRLTIAACPESIGTIVVRLRKEVDVPARRILTSGCGGGVTFDDLTKGCEPVESTLRVSTGKIFGLMHQLQREAALYRKCRGVHTAGLADGAGLLVVAEDVGRHNTLDKIRGECLMRGIPTEGRILLCTGRVSSEMVAKAAKMRVPIVASLTSPTLLSIQLAGQLGITIIGYVRGGEMALYSRPERLLASDLDGSVTQDGEK